MLTEMELPASAPLIDFGETLLPTLYSSTGRRQSLSLMNPIKAQSFRDPALDFLDIREVNEGENEGISNILCINLFHYAKTNRSEVKGSNLLCFVLFYSLTFFV